MSIINSFQVRIFVNINIYIVTQLGRIVDWNKYEYILQKKEKQERKHRFNMIWFDIVSIFIRARSYISLRIKLDLYNKSISNFK
jgi:hypothetical protein